MSKKDSFPAKKLIELHAQSLSYCSMMLKDTYHREAKKVLRKLAGVMGLTPGDYDIRSNKAGIAVSGEITLHTDRVYLQIAQSYGSRSDVLMRSCSGRQDYTGGMNHFAPIDVFRDLDRLAVYLDAVSANAVCGMHWNAGQYRYDIAQYRATRILTPELEHARDLFEAGDISIDQFELAIDYVEHQVAA